MRKLFNLHLFDGGEGSLGSAGSGAGGDEAGKSGSSGGGASYSYEQAEQIANARAELASQSALTKYFESQGMTKEEITAAIADFKAKKASQTDFTAIEKERDAALAKVAEMQNADYLRGKGVASEDLDYVLFKVNQKVDDKTDFKKAADAFLKEAPRFIGQGYRVVSTGKADGGSGTSQTANDAINATIRGAFGR